MRPRLNAVFLLVFVFFSFLGYALFTRQDSALTRHLQQQRERAKAKIQIIQLNYLIPPFGPLAGFAAGNGSLKPGEWKQYVDYYEKVRELMPQRWDAHAFLGFCYFYQGRTAEAAQAFERAVFLNPGAFWPLYDLGLLAAYSGNAPAAAALLSKAAALDPTAVLKDMLSCKLYADIRSSFPDFDRIAAGHLKDAYESALRLSALASAGQYAQQLPALARRLPVLIF